MSTIIEIIKPENYKFTKSKMYYIFIKEILKITGEEEILPHHEFSINYDEKFCYFDDFIIDYQNGESGEKIYRPYKIILKTEKIPKPLINIFVFTKIE